ncbi:hypothetical protein N7495_006440 [Penicillium taxi]|uniref:uncharacterized protein n=1 Tax=Penicillium taxi TaxID=168475 RepID=UPI002545A8B5|nr:uncharacterized protein N7495_006440 [Penicillium taxi]KAJ5894749.1 hypothetical protein N7495_006440 [Penicillium taxi]
MANFEFTFREVIYLIGVQAIWHNVDSFPSDSLEKTLRTRQYDVSSGQTTNLRMVGLADAAITRSMIVSRYALRVIFE